MYPIKTFIALTAAGAVAGATASYPANNRPPVNVLSSGVYEIVGNGASVWVLHTSTGKLKFYETSRNIKDKPLCSETQSFD